MVSVFLGGESGLGGAAYMYNAKGYLLDKIQGSSVDTCLDLLLSTGESL